METSSYAKILREARTRVVASLYRYFDDIDLAEDLFQEASLKAIQVWQEQGLPEKTTSWLIRVGRNKGIDIKRRNARITEVEIQEISDVGQFALGMEEDLDCDNGDDILRLLFTCCHPDLSRNQQIILALKVVAGLNVSEIARAFLIQPKSMEQRITRAKKRIAQKNIPYDAPTAEARLERIRAVQTTLYLLFNEGYAASGGDAHIRLSLCDEAIRLARLLHHIAPENTESIGLLALCLLQDSRRLTRLNDKGDLVLLEDQDRSQWNHAQIAEAQKILEHALIKKDIGPYQIQAAIAAVHAQAKKPEDTNWAEIDRLYQILETFNDSPVVRLNRAVAVWKRYGSRQALALIEPLDERLKNYMHYHGLRAAFHKELGHIHQARDAYKKALSLAKTSAERAHLEQQMEKL